MIQVELVILPRSVVSENPPDQQNQQPPPPPPPPQNQESGEEQNEEEEQEVELNHLSSQQNFLRQYLSESYRYWSIYQRILAMSSSVGLLSYKMDAYYN